MEKRLINKTVYTKGFYISLTLYKVKHSILAYVGGSTIVLTIAQGIGMLRDKPVEGWWTLFTGTIIIPAIVYLAPYLLNMRNYKKIVKDNKGEDLVVTLEMTDKKITCRNSLGQLQHCRYQDVKDITEKSNLFIISFKTNASPLYLSTAEDAFIGCSKQEIYDRIQKMNSDVKIFY